MSSLSPDLHREVLRLRSPDPHERARGAYNLGQMGPSAAPAAPALIDILADRAELNSPAPGASIHSYSPPNTPGRQAEAALVKIGPEAVPFLIEVLHDKNNRLCLGVSTALDCLMKDRAAPTPPMAISSDDLLMREEVVRALREITGRDFGADTNEWLNWWRKNKGRAATSAAYPANS